MKTFTATALCTGVLVSLVSLAACGADGSGGGEMPGSATGNDGGTAARANDAAQGETPITTLRGVWDLSGTDARGAYDGQIEVRDVSGDKVEVIRLVRYLASPVEDARELWTAWVGKGSLTGTYAEVEFTLARADFVRARGGVTRTDADKTPATVKGTISLKDGKVLAHFTGPGIEANETLSSPKPSGSAPIFAVARSSVATNGAPSNTERSLLMPEDYKTRPDVAPYVPLAEFQAGIAYVDIDRTDLDFYRAHPNALRVVNKVVDAPSLGETLARANAFRKTLAEKAAFFDAETPATFLEPATGQVSDSVVSGKQQPSGDGSLWTASYLASQALRALVAKRDGLPFAAEALANVAKSAAGMQLLVEIVPDSTTFARTIRAATGAPPNGWHTGTGAFSAYEWLEGGNNDMYKGLFYADLMAYWALCTGGQTGYEALCDRIRTNVPKLGGLSVVGGNTDGNRLLASWLNCFVNGADCSSARTQWLLQQTVIEQAAGQTVQLTTADWSGTHLTFVAFLGYWLLSDLAPLNAGGISVDPKPSLRKGFDKLRGDFTPFRMGIWSTVFATLATAPLTPRNIEDAKLRLTEIPAPRMQLDFDHRVSPDFVMSPYPTLPWKQDWMTSDRTASLHGFPLFEQPLDVYVWRSSPWNYKGNQEGIASPSYDYLHDYWLARWLKLLGPAD